MSSVFMISDAAKKVMVEAHVLRYWEEELGLPIKRNELGHRYYTEEDVKRFMEIKELKERGLQLKAIRMVLKNGKLDMLPKEMEEELSQQENAAAVLSVPEEKITGENKIVDIPLKTEADKPEIAEQRSFEEELKENASETVSSAENASATVNNEEKIPERKKEEASKAEKKKKKKAMVSTVAERQKAELQQEKQQKQKQQEKQQEKWQEEIPSYELAESQSESLKVETKEEKAARLQWLLQQLFRQTLQENNEYLCREIKESLLKELDYQFRVQEEKQEERDAERLKQEEEHYKKIDELLRKKRRLLKR